MKDELPLDAQVAISQTHLDQRWSEFREYWEKIATPELCARIWKLTNRSTPPTHIAADEWLLMSYALQLVIKQTSTDAVRRIMEDHAL